MILVWNPGSSSLKFEIFEVSEVLTSKSSSSVSLVVNSGISDHRKAVRFLYSHILDSGFADRIESVGVRVVHSGGEISDGKLIDKNSIHLIEKISLFAPLHNPAACKTIEESMKIFHVPHRAFFDTSFFENLPIQSRKYAIKDTKIDGLCVRRYGFHGISHEYVYYALGGKKLGKTISIHLGAGCSVVAIEDEKPIDTSMGFTPSEGLIMQTRAGDIDSGLVLALAKKLGIDETIKILNHKSGLSGYIGNSGEMLDVLYLSGTKIEDDDYIPPKSIKKNRENEVRAREALSMYTSRIKKYIGGYAAMMNGLDTVIFTGKIGAGSGEIRKMIMEKMDFLGKVNVLAIEPDEERAIAKKLIKYLK